MIIVLHGDHQVGSRGELNRLITLAKQAGESVRYLDGLKLSLPEWDSVRRSAGLFGQELIVVENFFSRPVSAEKSKLAATFNTISPDRKLIFWEKKETSKTALKSLPSTAKIQLFKAPTVIFSFIDSVYPGNLTQSLELLQTASSQVEAGFIFVMLARHVSDLIIVRSGEPTVPPWKGSKLRPLANRFQEDQLLSLHQGLLDIDRAFKTGGSKLGLLVQLELLLTRLLAVY